MIVQTIKCFFNTAGHAYWRVFCTDNWGDATGIIIAEVEFLDSVGAVITATGGTAIGSDDVGGNEFSKAFDGTATAWFANSAPTNQWVGYQFSSNVAATGVRLTMATSGTNFLTRMPKNCKLEYSDDGSSWTTVYSFVNMSLSGSVQTTPETPPASGYHKLWRVFCVDNNGGTTLIVLDEIEFRATAGGADQIAAMTSNNGTASQRVDGSSIATVGNEGWRAFNDITDSANDWAANGTTNQWIGVIVSTAIKVEEVLLKCGNTTNDRNRAPKNMRIEYSDDGTTWTTQKTLAAQTAWGVNESRVLAAV